MAYLEVGGRRQAIPVGETVLGTDGSGRLVISGEDLTTQYAVVRGLPDGQAAIRLVDEKAVALVNGVRLGAQPVPLLHGDKVEIAGQELLFVDERRSGSTLYVQAVDPSKLVPGKPSARRAPTSGTGGRLVSLTDGREYAITAASLLIGREAGCDVVLTSKNVSRRHAEIVATPKGYLLVDSSTNGTFVNGVRVQEQQVLARADVIRCGEHEFRFYADVAPAAPPPVPAEEAQATTPPPPPAPMQEPQEAPAAPPAAAAPGPPAREVPVAPPKQQAAPDARAQPAAGPPTPPPGAEQRLSHTLHGVPAVPRPGGAARGRPAPPYRPPEPPKRRETPVVPPTPAPPMASVPKPQPPPPRQSGGEHAVLANVVVRSGPLRGQRYPIRVPIVNVGRAEYNDIVIADESVSTSHAKLQRREGIWMLVDLDSTNGTLVDGERVQGEVPLAPGALIRFGAVQTIFEPTDDTIDAQKGSSTRLMGAIRLPKDSGGKGGSS